MKTSRRDFLRSVFAAGVVATVPMSVFNDNMLKAHTKDKAYRTVKRPVNFNQGCFLYLDDGTLIAYTNDFTVLMDSDVIPLYYKDSEYIEYIKGANYYEIEMRRINQLSSLRNAKTALESVRKCNVLVTHKKERWEGECYIREVTASFEVLQEIKIDIIISGALTRL